MRKKLLITAIAVISFAISGCQSTEDFSTSGKTTTDSSTTIASIVDTTNDSSDDTSDDSSTTDNSSATDDSSTTIDLYTTIMDITTIKEETSSNDEETTSIKDESQSFEEISTTRPVVIDKTTTNKETTTKKNSYSETETTTKKNSYSETETTTKKNSYSETETTTKKNSYSETETTTKKNSYSETETTTKKNSYSETETTTKKNSSFEEETTTPRYEPETPAVKELYSDKARELANNVLTTIIKPESSNLDKAIAIQEWIFNNIDYDYFSGSKYPEDIFKNKVSERTGFAHLYKILAEEAGLTVTCIEGGALDRVTLKYEDYAWIQINLNGSWYNLDIYSNAHTYHFHPITDHNPDADFYDLFLVSDNTFNSDYTASDNAVYPMYITSMDTKTCPTDFSRILLLEYMEANNMYNIVFAANMDELLNTINEKFETNIETVNIFYYNPSFIGSNNGSFIADISDELYTLPFVVNCNAGWFTDDFGICIFKIDYPYPYETWNNLPIAKTTEDWIKILEEYFVEGDVRIVVRVEADGEFHFTYETDKYKTVNGSDRTSIYNYNHQDYFLADYSATVILK